MPRQIEFTDIKYNMKEILVTRPVATKEELLEFANKLRKAGGGDLITDLFPSVKGDPDSCLIATALNFESYIEWDSFDRWYMYVYDAEVATNIGKSIPDVCVIVPDEEDSPWAIQLPEHIGNAARAFDDGLAFQEYAHED